MTTKFALGRTPDNLSGFPALGFLGNTTPRRALGYNPHAVHPVMEPIVPDNNQDLGHPSVGDMVLQEEQAMDNSRCAQTCLYSEQ